MLEGVAAEGAADGEPGLRRSPARLERLREVRAVSYQFTEPFEVDSSRSERTLGLAPTGWDEAVAATLAWWRAEHGTAAA